MNKQLKRWIVIIVGWLFIALGVVGLFLPVLQGVLFLIIGLLILSTEFVWAHRLLQRLRQKFPSLSIHMDRAAEHLRRWGHKVGIKSDD